MAIIDKPSDYFNTLLYTGNGNAGNAQTGVGFQPDLVWIKNRSQADWHQLFNAVRGASYVLYSNQASAESDASSSFASFNSDGFTVNANDGTNGNGENLVAWNWKANGSGSSNTAGSINSTVSANTTSGFSIVKYTGTGSNATVGHGLGSVPKMIIVKDLVDAENWEIYNAALGATKSFYLNTTNAAFTSSERWNDTSPTNSVFSVGTAKTNNANNNIIAYCFADVQGFSKFGSYTGNGSASSGPLIYTNGFKPAFVLIKNSSAATDWCLRDAKRSPINVTQDTLFPNTADTESTGGTSYDIDFLSNGFKIRSTSSRFNTSGNTYIYMAFAENPFVTSTDNNSIPTTAR